jgi:hypothetical protein
MNRYNISSRIVNPEQAVELKLVSVNYLETPTIQSNEYTLSIYQTPFSGRPKFQVHS